MIKTYAQLVNDNVVNIIVSEENFLYEDGYVEYKDDASIRYNSAKIGSKYDQERDAFIDPQEYPSWTLNEETLKWNPPIEKPSGIALWIEQEQRWHQPGN
jgi:hypothetical protein